MGEARDLSALWIGKMLHDKWHIDAEIGRGGVATVYRATNRHGQVAAIKMIHAELARNEEVRKRFLREGYAANKVGHPQVVQVIDDDVTPEGIAYIVMELLGTGELLEDRRARLGGKLPFEQVADVALQVLDVLAAAHGNGIVHRDIKPENVFVLADGVAKVLDFGIAHIKEAASKQEATATGLLLGTPEYMAPEQALGTRGQIDAQTDIYALGATMFTLLSGEAVHVCDTLTALLVAAASRQPRSLARANKELPREIVAVVDKALMLEKGRRWPNAKAMRDALKKAVPTATPMRDEPSLPPPSSSMVDTPREVEVPSPSVTTPHVSQQRGAASSPPMPAQRGAASSPPMPAQRGAASSPPMPAQRGAASSPPMPAQRGAASSPPMPAQRASVPPPPQPARVGSSPSFPPPAPTGTSPGRPALPRPSVPPGPTAAKSGMPLPMPVVPTPRAFRPPLPPPPPSPSSPGQLRVAEEAPSSPGSAPPPPSLAPLSGPTAVIPGRGGPPLVIGRRDFQAESPFDDPLDDEDLPTQTKLPPLAAAAVRPALPDMPSDDDDDIGPEEPSTDPWTDKSDADDLGAATVAMKGAPARLAAAPAPAPAPPRPSVPRPAASVSAQPTSMAAFKPSSMSAPAPTPMSAPPPPPPPPPMSMPMSGPPPPMLMTGPPPPMPMSGAPPMLAPLWTPQPFGPPQRLQRAPELVLHPSARRPPSMLVIVAISIAAFLIVSLSVASCLFLSTGR